MLWKLRAQDAANVVDTVVVAAWRDSALGDESTSSAAVAERLRANGRDYLADMLLAVIVERGLTEVTGLATAV